MARGPDARLDQALPRLRAILADAQAGAVLRPDLDDTVAPALRTDADVAAGAQRIERFLRDWFAGTLRLPPEALDAERSFGELGVDSVAAVELAQALSARVGREVSPSALWTWRTPAALSRHLAERVEA